MIAPSSYSKKAAAKTGKGNKPLLFAFAGGIAVVAIAITAWMLTGTEAAKEESKEKTKGRIADVEPAKVSPKPEQPAPEKRKRYKDLSREEKLARIRAKYGDNIPDNLKGEVYFLENPPQQTFHPAKSKSDIFKHRSEQIIASLLRIEPGDFILQRRKYDAKFDKDFEASLAEPIEFEDTDTDEQRELKQAVIDTKAEIVERMKEGARPSELLNDAADNLYELGRYKRDLQEQLAKFKMDASYTDQDIEDFVNAANQMLRSKGASEIPMPRFFMRRISLKLAARRAAQKSIKEKNK